MIIANRANGIDISAIVAAYRGLGWREDLEVPARRAIWCFKDFLRQEIQGWPLVAGRHDDHVAFYEFLMTDAALWNAFGAVVEVYAVLAHVFDVTTQPFGFSGADLLEDLAVDHGRFGEEALIGGSDVFEISIEEDAEDRFGDPAEESLLAEDIECEKGINHSVAWDDPFVGACENFDFSGVGVDSPFESFDT